MPMDPLRGGREDKPVSAYSEVLQLFNKSAKAKKAKKLQVTGLTLSQDHFEEEMLEALASALEAARFAIFLEFFSRHVCDLA